MVNNQIHNGSKRLLIAKYVALPRKCSVEKPVIHTNNSEMKKNITRNARNDCLFMIIGIAVVSFAGLLINLMNAMQNPRIPRIINAIIARRLDEYPKRIAVF